MRFTRFTSVSVAGWTSRTRFIVYTTKIQASACPAYVSGRRWNVTFPLETPGERCLKRPRGTRQKEHLHQMPIGRSAVSIAGATTPGLDDIFPVVGWRGYRSVSCRQNDKFVIVNLYNWHGTHSGMPATPRYLALGTHEFMANVPRRVSVTFPSLRCTALIPRAPAWKIKYRRFCTR